MRNQRLPAEAAKLIEPIVDLQAPNPATTLYLGCLVEARRDEAFRAALAKASAEVRKDPETLWLLAIHSWNIGDLPNSRRAVDALLANRPDSAPARLLKIEILDTVQRNRRAAAGAQRPIEIARLQSTERRAPGSLTVGPFWADGSSSSLRLQAFPRKQRNLAGLALLSRTSPESRNKACLSRRVVGSEDRLRNTAVDIEYDDGEKQFVIVEPDGKLRRLDEDSWEPDHRLIRQIFGLSVGAQFSNPATGKPGTIKQIGTSMSRSITSCSPTTKRDFRTSRPSA